MVVEFVIAAAQGLSRPLDLRTAVTCWSDYPFWRGEGSAIHWEDLVRPRLIERISTSTRPVDDRRDRVAEEVWIANEIRDMDLPAEGKERLFAEKTHRSRATYYRRLQLGPGTNGEQPSGSSQSHAEGP